MRNGAGKRAGYRSALRSRDLRWLLGSQLVSSSGSWAYNVALMVLLFDRTHSASWVAAGALCRFLPMLVFSAYGGVIAERFERVRLMQWLNVFALLLQASLEEQGEDIQPLHETDALEPLSDDAPVGAEHKHRQEPA